VPLNEKAPRMTKPAFRVLEPGDESALEAFLLSRIESSMFLIGNLRTAGLPDDGRPYSGTYAAACDDGRLLAAVAHYWNRNLVLQAPAHVEVLWQLAVEASQRPLSGLIGPSDQVEAVKRAVGAEKERVRMDETELLYRLPLEQLAVPTRLAMGQLKARRIELADVELITQWKVAYSIEALQEEDVPALRKRCRADVERSRAEGRTWVLFDGGRPVACSSFNTAIREAVQVGGVWTPPPLRRRGYARNVVAASLLDARREGAHTAILFTGEGNLPAQKAYRALGFRHIGDYRMVFYEPPIACF